MVVYSFILSRSPGWKDEGFLRSNPKQLSACVCLGLLVPRHFKEPRTDTLFSGCVCLCLSVYVCVCVCGGGVDQELATQHPEVGVPFASHSSQHMISVLC